MAFSYFYSNKSVQLSDDNTKCQTDCSFFCFGQKVQMSIKSSKSMVCDKRHLGWNVYGYYSTDNGIFVLHNAMDRCANARHHFHCRCVRPSSLLLKIKSHTFFADNAFELGIEFTFAVQTKTMRCEWNFHLNFKWCSL